MNLGALKPPAGSRKKRKRVGRGGDHGGTSCKGNKGQNARSGGGVRPSFEGGQMPISRRLPKRGFHNKFRRIVGIVNVGQLVQFPQGTIIDEELLLNSGLVKRRVEAVKILGNGDIEQALSVKVALISKAAKDKIIKAGGTIIEVN